MIGFLAKSKKQAWSEQGGGVSSVIGKNKDPAVIGEKKAGGRLLQRRLTLLMDEKKFRYHQVEKKREWHSPVRPGIPVRGTASTSGKKKNDIRVGQKKNAAQEEKLAA